MLMLILLLTPALYAHANDDPSTRSPLGRVFEVETRGILNVIGLPAEVGTTGAREVEMHSRLWPVTYLPRFFTNVMIRSASALHDIVIMPFTAPFTRDIKPWTRPLGLPDYPWQVS